MVDDRWNVLHVSASASRFFQQAGGTLARRLPELVRPELRDDLPLVLHKALEGLAAQLTPFVPVRFNGASHRVAVLVQRHMRPENEQVYLLVTFLDAGTTLEVSASPDQAPSSELEMRGLRDQLSEAERRIASMRDEHLLTNEDLRAANEELQSLNEEYRSTTEELETSKEELQSINEELQTVNNELKLKLDDLSRANADLENLMVATNVATLFLTADLRIRRHTPALEAIFNIRSRDYDRPIGDQTHTLNYDALEADARQVLASSAPVLREVTSRDGQAYILRVNPYRTDTTDQVEGVVLTFVDVTELRAAQAQVADDLRRMTRVNELGALLAGPGAARGMLDEVLRAAIDVTGAEMGYLQRREEDGALSIVAQQGFPPAFLEGLGRVDAGTASTCGSAMAGGQRVIVEDVRGSPIFADSESASVMAAAEVGAGQSTPLFDRSGHLLGMVSTHYRAAHHFDSGELQWLDLLSQHAASVLERERAENQLAQAKLELEGRVAERTRWLSLMHDVSRAINEASTWDEALHQVLRCLVQGDQWQVGSIYLPDPHDPNMIAPAISYVDDERFGAFAELSQRQRYARGERLPGRVYAENLPVWINDPDQLAAALPVRGPVARQAGLRTVVALAMVLGEDVIGVLELLSAAPHPPSDQLTTLIRDAGSQIARVLEREQTTARMADMVWREQQSLLHTLHDSLGQTLTGLGMLGSGLHQRLADADPADAEIAAHIADQAQQALEQVRQLARSLFPVQVDAESLMSALRDLASATEALHKIQVRVEGATPAGLSDGKIATELYRIVQEALTNAVKHAQARTVVIRLTRQKGVLEARVTDDGVGLPHHPSGDGMGLRIMRYRAGSIGARLAIEAGTSGGTVVTCTLRQTPAADTPDGQQAKERAR